LKQIPAAIETKGKNFRAGRSSAEGRQRRSKQPFHRFSEEQ